MARAAMRAFSDLQAQFAARAGLAVPPPLGAVASAAPPDRLHGKAEKVVVNRPR